MWIGYFFFCVIDGLNVFLYVVVVGGGVGFFVIVIVVGCCIKRKCNIGEFILWIGLYFVI